MEATNKLSDAGLYTDFNGLQKLRSKLGSQQQSQSNEATKEVAKQFEALFLQMMLKSMRDATDTIGNAASSTESDQTRFYQEMFDKQIALDLASREKGHGLGIAAMLESDLAGNQKPDMGENEIIGDIELIRNQINLSGALIRPETGPDHNTGQD